MILVGKSPGKPKFGCPMCSACTPYTDDGSLYTISDLLALHQVRFFKNAMLKNWLCLNFHWKKSIVFIISQKYVADGSVSKKQKLYQNVTNQPLLTGEESHLVWKILSVPELHLLIGKFWYFCELDLAYHHPLQK